MMDIRSFNTHRRFRVRHAEVRELVRLVLRRERVTKAAINVVFVDDAQMTDLNGTYLKHYYTTDVLSFPLEEPAPGSVEGEVYVNLDQASRQSAQYRQTFAAEKRRLVIHGVLHLAGHSDATPRLRTAMAGLEDRYLASFAARR
jgi:rRNA maturation RNase YbeY